MSQTFLVTGGTGFLGAALIRRLIKKEHHIRVLDNNVRGAPRRLADISHLFEFIDGDVRDIETVSKAVAGVDTVIHLAAINGTEYFYSKPELVLDVGVRAYLTLSMHAARMASASLSSPQVLKCIKRRLTIPPMKQFLSLYRIFSIRDFHTVDLRSSANF